MEKASPSNNYHYNKNLNTIAKINKRSMTKSAACMWKYVLGQKQMLGYQFRRERPILNYILRDIGREIEISRYCFTPNPSRGTTHIPALSAKISIILVAWIGENALVKPQGHRKRNRDK